MLKNLKKEFVMGGKLRFGVLYFIFGLYLVGLIMAFIIMNVDSDPGEYFPLASLMGLMAYAMGTVFFEGIFFIQEYQIALAMGSTRRTKLVAHVIACLIKSVVGLGIVIALGALEQALAQRFFPSFGISPELGQFLKLKYFLIFLIVPQPIAFFISGVSCRFGKKGYAVIYFVFLFFCIFGTRIVRYITENAEGSMRWLVSFLVSVPLAGWIAAAALVLAVLALLGARWLYKADAQLGWN